MARERRRATIPADLTPPQLRHLAEKAMKQAVEDMLRAMLQQRQQQREPGKEPPPPIFGRVRSTGAGVTGEIVSPVPPPKRRRRRRRGAGKAPPAAEVLEWLQRGKGRSFRLDRQRKNRMQQLTARVIVVGQSIAKNTAARPLSMSATAKRKRRRRARIARTAPLRAAADGIEETLEAAR